MEASSDLQPAAFVRNSKLRKSFRIRHRYNPKLPPAAVIFMRSIEASNNNNFGTINNKSIFYQAFAVAKKKNDKEDSLDISTSSIESFDPIIDEKQLLVRKPPASSQRSSLRKSKEQKLKITKIFNFFRK